MIRIISFVVKQTAQPSNRFRENETRQLRATFFGDSRLSTGYHHVRRGRQSLARGRQADQPQGGAYAALFWVLFHKALGNFSQQKVPRFR